MKNINFAFWDKDKPSTINSSISLPEDGKSQVIQAWRKTAFLISKNGSQLTITLVHPDDFEDYIGQEVLGK